MTKAYFFRFIVLAFGIVLIEACNKEDDPNPSSVAVNLIDRDQDDSYMDLENLIPDEKVLLLQEFTGVYCYTCPLAHGITKEIIEQYPNQIAAMNIHSYLYSIYSNPDVMGNKYDFRTYDSDTIVSMLGGILSVPSGAFDMTLMKGEEKIISTSRENWKEYSSDQLLKTTEVNIDIATSLNQSSRDLKVVVKYHFIKDVDYKTYYSIGIVENEIIDKQFVDTVVIDDYHHQHIFRDMVSDAKGSPLTNSASVGSVFIKVFHYNLPEDWNEENIEIISYVHERESNWNVLQSDIAKINVK